MLEFTLTEEQQELRKLARKVARDQYAPLARSGTATAPHFPMTERKQLAELGLLGISLPEEYGGGGRPLIDALIVLEEFAKELRSPRARSSRPTPGPPA